MTLEAYYLLMGEQDARCAICKQQFAPETHTELSCHIDHCHETGKVRGLLCCACNMGIGKFRENPSYLASAITYLQTHK